MKLDIDLSIKSRELHQKKLASSLIYASSEIEPSLLVFFTRDLSKTPSSFNGTQTMPRERGRNLCSGGTASSDH